MGTMIEGVQGVFSAGSTTAEMFWVSSRGQQEGREVFICGHCRRAQFDRGQQACIVCQQPFLVPLEPLCDLDAPPRRVQSFTGIVDVCSRLRELRDLLGVSQRELALAAGCNRTHITKYEHGRIKPTIIFIEHLAGALGINMAELFDGEIPVKDLALLSLLRSPQGDLLEQLIMGLPQWSQNTRNMLANNVREFSRWKSLTTG